MRNSGKSEGGRASRNASLIERFLEMMAAERGASTNTLSAYRRDLEIYALDVADLKASGPDDIRAHLESLEAAGMARSSVMMSVIG